MRLFAFALATLHCGLLFSSEISEALFEAPENAVSLKPVPLELGVEPFVLEIGTLEVNQPTVFRIPVKSAHPEDLTLSDIKVSCGCMAAAPSSKEFPKKSEIDLFLYITPKEVGRIRRSMALHFANDARVLTIYFSGIAKPRYSVQPQKLKVNASTSTVEIELLNNFPSDAEDQIPDVDLLGGDATIINTKIAENDSTTIKVRADVSNFLKAGQRKSNAVLSLTLGDPERCDTYQLSIERTDKLRITPSVLVERQREGETRAVSAYLHGDDKLLSKLSQPNSLRCASEHKGVSFSIKSKRFVGESLLIVKLEASNPDGPKSVGVRWEDASGVELGRSRHCPVTQI